MNRRRNPGFPPFYSEPESPDSIDLGSNEQSLLARRSPRILVHSQKALGQLKAEPAHRHQIDLGSAPSRIFITMLFQPKPRHPQICSNKRFPIFITIRQFRQLNFQLADLFR